jgi:cell division inhibitor SepF
MDGLFRRAKAFIGLEEGEEGSQVEGGSGRQLEITSILRGGTKRENRTSAESASDIIIHEPKVYEDSLNISANLRAGNPVIVNLKHLEPSEGTRLIDFVCGTAYAIDGHMVKIGESIFLFTSTHVNIINADDKASLGEEISQFDTKKESFFSHR